MLALHEKNIDVRFTFINSRCMQDLGSSLANMAVEKKLVHSCYVAVGGPRRSAGRDVKMDKVSGPRRNFSARAHLYSWAVSHDFKC